MRRKRQGGNVLRHHTSRPIQEQTVSDHSWGVAVICLELWPECSKNLIKAALYHDIHEGILGDVPAQVKRKFYYFSEAIDRAEQVINKELGTHVSLDIEEQERLKIADVMELLWFSVEEVERGNNNFISVCGRCFSFLDQLPLDNKVSEMRQQLEKRYTL